MYSYGWFNVTVFSSNTTVCFKKRHPLASRIITCRCKLFSFCLYQISMKLVELFKNIPVNGTRRGVFEALCIISSLRFACYFQISWRTNCMQICAEGCLHSPYSHIIHTSSEWSHPDSRTPHPLCTHSAKVNSLPVHFRSLSQMCPVPLPSYLLRYRPDLLTHIK